MHHARAIRDTESVDERQGRLEKKKIHEKEKYQERKKNRSRQVKGRWQDSRSSAKRRRGSLRRFDDC